jgi:hypothetical protein
MILKFLVMFQPGQVTRFIPKNDPGGEEGNKWGNVKDSNKENEVFTNSVRKQFI